MPDLSTIAAVRVEDAIWFDCTVFPPDPDPTDPEQKRLLIPRVKLRRMNNADFLKLRNKKTEQRAAFFRAGGQYADDAANSVVEECLAENIVVEWEHFYENRAPLPCTPENVMKMFSVNKGQRDREQWGAIFKEWVLQSSSNAAAYRLKDDEAGKGN